MIHLIGWHIILQYYAVFINVAVLYTLLPFDAGRQFARATFMENSLQSFSNIKLI